jgi:hypothetical protein
MANEAKKQPRVKLDLVHNSQEFVAVVQKECGIRAYDLKKIRTRLNCDTQQARILITLAQIADAQQPTGKAAKA